MNLEKVKPWNWFKHESSHESEAKHIPVAKKEATALASNGSGPSIFRLHSEIDRVFDDLFNRLGFPRTSRLNELTHNAFIPSVDIAGNAKSYEITLDVPGMTESDLSIELNGDQLTIQGKKEEKTEHDDKHYYRVERSYGSFQRTLSLPDDAVSEEISASLKEGVLALSIPKKEMASSPSRQISIHSS